MNPTQTAEMFALLERLIRAVEGKPECKACAGTGRMSREKTKACPHCDGCGHVEP